MHRDTVIAWIRLGLLIAFFVVSCAGLGYLASGWVRRRRWPPLVLGALCAAISFIWPAIVIAWAYYGAYHYQRRGITDPGDAPAMVIAGALFAGAPILFLASLGLAVGGAAMSKRKKESVSALRE